MLRSGGAEGADKAFERGARTRKEIFRPIDATPEAMAEAASVHPAWHYCSEEAKKLHGRNAQILLGYDLTVPAKFVAAYTLTPERGGTSLGLRLAKKHNIMTFNLAVTEEVLAFTEFLSLEAHLNLGRLTELMKGNPT